MVTRRNMHKIDFTKDLAVELWVLYCLGLIIIACRVTARRMLLRSFKKLQLDDYIMIVLVLPFTMCFVSVFQVAQNGNSYVYMEPGAFEMLSESEIKMAIEGSKWNLALEEFILTTLWMVKACILLFYGRLTLGLWQNWAVKVLAGYCVLGYILVQALLLGVWCRPISQYWAVLPTYSRQCGTYYRHMITQSVFNMSSDLLMILVPLPLLIQSRIPIRRKLIVCGVFSLGIFVILAAALNRYYNFHLKYNLIFLNWYIGEITTAVLVANIPLCWPLFRHIFHLTSFSDSRGSRNRNEGGTSSDRERRSRSNGTGTETSRIKFWRGDRPSINGTTLRNNSSAVGFNGEGGFRERERERERERNTAEANTEHTEPSETEVVTRPPKAKLDGRIIDGRDVEMGFRNDEVAESSRKKYEGFSQTHP